MRDIARVVRERRGHAGGRTEVVGDVRKLLIAPPVVVAQRERAGMIWMFPNIRNHNASGPGSIDMDDSVRVPFNQNEKHECRRGDVPGAFSVSS